MLILAIFASSLVALMEKVVSAVSSLCRFHRRHLLNLFFDYKNIHLLTYRECYILLHR